MKRNKTDFGLISRNNTPIKESRTITFPRINNDLQSILDRFTQNLSDIKSRFLIADTLLNLPSPSAPDLEGAQDIWRSQIVFLDSALDFYFHEIIKYSYIQMFYLDWPQSEEYKRIKVSLQFAIDLANNPNSVSKLSDEIDEMNRFTCFMGIKQINWLFKAIDIKITLNKAEQNLIKELFNRRNQIAHQSDRLPNNPEKQGITKEYVESTINEIESLVVNKIHLRIVNKSNSILETLNSNNRW